MDRLIALSQALAKRYDRHPLFEMIGFTKPRAAFPRSRFRLCEAYYAQLQRWFDASKKAWDHTQLRLNANYGGSDATMRTLIDNTIKGGDVAVGGPDPEIAARSVQANRRVPGRSRWRKRFARHTLPGWASRQGFGLGRKSVLSLTRTPDVSFDYQYNTMRANYMIWIHNEYLGGNEQKWSTGILPFIRSVNGKIHTECPLVYDNRCSSD